MMAEINIEKVSWEAAEEVAEKLDAKAAKVDKPKPIMASAECLGGGTLSALAQAAFGKRIPKTTEWKCSKEAKCPNCKAF